MSNASFTYVERSRTRVRPTNPCLRDRGLPLLRPTTLAELLEADYLNSVFERLRSEGGRAPGVDGIRYDDLSKGERSGLFRDLAADVLTGRYRPQPPRGIQIPKSPAADGSPRSRTLQLRSIQDRLLAAAVASVIGPVAEQMFYPNSYGFRRSRDRFDMLADLTICMEQSNAWVVTADDVATAFDSVNTNLVSADLRRVGGISSDVLNLADMILRGHEGPTRTRGIDQGCPLSPLALNVHLHYRHDIHVENPRVPDVCFWGRYADNIIYLTRDTQAGVVALERSRSQLREAELTLKGDPGIPRDTSNGETLHFLGYRLTSKGGKAIWTIPNSAWPKLEEALQECHLAGNPIEMAKATITGWIQGWKAASCDLEVLANRVINLLRSSGFQGLMPKADILETFKRGQSQWTVTLQQRALRVGS